MNAWSVKTSVQSNTLYLSVPRNCVFISVMLKLMDFPGKYWGGYSPLSPLVPTPMKNCHKERRSQVRFFVFALQYRHEIRIFFSVSRIL